MMELPKTCYTCTHDCPGKKLWALGSWGKDSCTLIDKLYQQGRLAGVITLDTGISMPGHLEGLAAFVREYDVPLEVYKSPPAEAGQAPTDYRGSVLAYGFPKGAWGHKRIWGALKDRAQREAARTHPGEIFASGVRKDESSRRYRNAEACSEFRFGVWIHAEVLEVSNEAIHRYVRQQQLRVSPWRQLYDLPTDCKCGAMAHRGEARRLKQVSPKGWEEIAALQEEVRGLHPFPYNLWGDQGASAIRPRLTPKYHPKKDQMRMDRFDEVGMMSTCGTDGCGGTE